MRVRCTKRWIVARTPIAQSVVGNLYRWDGITPERTALVVNREVSFRQMMGHDHPPKVYGWKKLNHDYALRALRPSVAARAGSGKKLEIAAARVRTAEEWPPSTNSDLHRDDSGTVDPGDMGDH